MLMLYSYILYEASGNQCNGCDGHTMVYDADGVSGRKLAILPVARHHYLREESHHRATQEEMCNGLLTTGDFLTLFNDTITVLQNDDSLVNVISLDGNIVEQERRAFRMPKQQSYRV
jgi:hypothetical protein